MLAVLCALGSSLLYALASVLQHRGAIEQPEEQSLKVGLLVRLLRHPAWLIGTACDAGGYALQFVALGHGAIVVVQPLLVCGLLFALPIGAAWAGRRLTGVDWLGAVLVCAGLAIFLLVANPANGRDDTSPGRWIGLLVGVTVLTGVLTGVATQVDARRRAVLLAGSAGVLYGAAAALTKTSAHLLGKGVVPLVTHWQPYVLVLFGGAGMLFAQSAFQAGALDYSLPTMTVVDPVVSIAIGAWFFDEAIASRPGEVVVEILSLAAMSAGVWLLARFEAQLSRPERSRA
ncbi:MAG TPA: DMT family transporter [Acidimicrobiales bacterium]|nr:DMT family transporter [Acidimicrobiales bacterium]